MLLEWVVISLLTIVLWLFFLSCLILSFLMTQKLLCDVGWIRYSNAGKKNHISFKWRDQIGKHLLAFSKWLKGALLWNGLDFCAFLHLQFNIYKMLMLCHSSVLTGSGMKYSCGNRWQAHWEHWLYTAASYRAALLWLSSKARGLCKKQLLLECESLIFLPQGIFVVGRRPSCWKQEISENTKIRLCLEEQVPSKHGLWLQPQLLFAAVPQAAEQRAGTRPRTAGTRPISYPQLLWLSPLMCFCHNSQPSWNLSFMLIIKSGFQPLTRRLFLLNC